MYPLTLIFRTLKKLSCRERLSSLKIPLWYPAEALPLRLKPSKKMSRSVAAISTVFGSTPLRLIEPVFTWSWKVPVMVMPAKLRKEEVLCPDFRVTLTAIPPLKMLPEPDTVRYDPNMLSVESKRMLRPSGVTVSSNFPLIEKLPARLTLPPANTRTVRAGSATVCDPETSPVWRFTPNLEMVWGKLVVLISSWNRAATLKPKPFTVLLAPPPI